MSAPVVLVLLVLAFVAANLPFLVERRFLILPPKREFKSIGWRLLELIALYFIVGMVAHSSNATWERRSRNAGSSTPSRCACSWCLPTPATSIATCGGKDSFRRMWGGRGASFVNRHGPRD